MRPYVLTALAVAAVVTGGAGARVTAETVALRALLDAAQEVPPPSGNVSAARGTFTAVATRNGTGATLAWRLTFTGLTGAAAAAHVHTAPAGQAGPVSIPLCGPCASGATGTAEIDATLLAALQGGTTYVNVHTPTNRAGEIRAQISSLASARAALDAGQEVPRAKAARRAAGRFVVTAVKTGPSASLKWRLTFSRLTGRAAAAHIHIGRRGVAGPVIVPLCAPCASGATGRATTSATALAALESGRAYVNVHTSRNPAGEIRGQIPAVPLTLTP